jgi:ABC-type transport system involved in cytochrome bd biosynthesis fused ATPase/permease subunit
MAGIRGWLAEAPARRLVILVTHRRGSASKADRVYRVDSGKLELCGDLAVREAEPGGR